MSTIKLKQTYMDLSNKLYSKIEPYNNISSKTLLLNKELIKSLQIDQTFLQSKEGNLFLSGSTNQYGPLYSQAYAGHQYGHFTNLGDGRAVILGELVVGQDLYDLQLKGSGRTPYSRRGDGKATLYSMLREYLISEAMYYLNIPTTRSLAVLDTNMKIPRMTLEQGGILCRVAKSHIRVGTFEYVNVNTDLNTLKEFTDYTIKRHFNDITDKENKYQLFLRQVIKRQAKLIAKWQSVGFVHGVMNTDNMLISGETIDYGPCAFLDTYDPTISFSSIDQNGRYAYQNQPYIGSWNLTKLAESILVLLNEDINQAVEIANQELMKFKDYFEEEYYHIFSKKLGFTDITKEEHIIIDELLLIMRKYKADFTNTFRLLTLDQYDDLPFFKTEDFKLWFQKWTRQLGYRHIDPKERIAIMEEHNPSIIPRNHLVEEALIKASKESDYSLFNDLLDKLRNPYQYKVIHDKKYTEANKSKDPYITYCGT